MYMCISFTATLTIVAPFVAAINSVMPTKAQRMGNILILYARTLLHSSLNTPLLFQIYFD